MRKTGHIKDPGELTEGTSYKIGKYHLDVARGALFCRDREIPLRPKSFAVLQHLVARPGVLVTKQELLDTVWGDTVVTEDSVTQCIRDIRKAFGDDPQAVITTVPRRGYRFEPPPSEQPTTSASSARRNSLLGTLVLVILAGSWWVWMSTGESQPPRAANVNVHALAVLPFLDLSRQQDQAYVAGGIADELRDQLGATGGLRVAARSSSQIVLTEGVDAPAMSRRLGVDALIEGSVRQRGRRLHLSVQLIEGESGLTLWSKAYTAEPDQLQAVQQQLVHNLLDRVLPDREKQRADKTTVDASAHELMLLARHHEQQATESTDLDSQSLLDAIALYRQAAEADPDSALIQTRLAGALLYFGDLTGAEAPVHRALILDPNLSEVQETLGRYYWARGLPGAGAAWRRAIELNANNADALASYAYWYWQQSNSEGPEELFRRALALDPLNLKRYADLGSFLGHEAREEATREVIADIEKNFTGANAFRLRARLHELLGELDHSIALTLRARNEEPDNPLHRWALAELYAEIGDAATALRLEPRPEIGLLFKLRKYDELIIQAEERIFDEPDDLLLRYLLAYAYNVRGRFHEAHQLLISAGLPGIIMEESRQAIDLEAFFSYVNALAGTGEKGEARAIALWFLESRKIENNSWWINTFQACLLAVVGQDDEAFLALRKVPLSPRLPWDAILMDLPCLQRYQDAPEYQAALLDTAERRADVRRRLSATLLDYGVSL